MVALYELFRTPQPKDEEKVRYHARTVVTGNDGVAVVAYVAELS